MNERQQVCCKIQQMLLGFSNLNSIQNKETEYVAFLYNAFRQQLEQVLNSVNHTKKYSVVGCFIHQKPIVTMVQNKSGNQKGAELGDILFVYQEEVDKKIWNNSSSHYKLREGDSFTLGNFNFLVISNTYTDENDSSLVLYSTIDNKKLLFMGDASIKSEKYILDNCNLSDITILKVGHHGSRTSSSEEFIENVNPTYALISAGVDNKFNHPHEEIIERLEENGSIIFNTQEDGMVMFDFTNNKIKTYT